MLDDTRLHPGISVAGTDPAYQVTLNMPYPERRHICSAGAGYEFRWLFLQSLVESSIHLVLICQFHEGAFPMKVPLKVI